MNIELHDISRVYGESRALHSLNLSIGESVRVLALIGPSGGGKSTLLRLLGGLEVPDTGEIRIGGKNLPKDEAGLLAHRRANGYVFQSFNLFPHLDASSNVALPLIKVHGRGESEARSLAQASLERFGLGAHARKFPAELSGGQQQRVALARAIVSKPKLLLLDEPTSALDPEMTSEVLEVVAELCRDGQEIILATHEMGFARAVADQIVFLDEGSISETGPPDQLFDRPTHEVVKRFLGKVMRW